MGVQPSRESGAAVSLVDALRIINGAIKDKTYQDLPLGAEVAEFLRIKRKRLTPASERAYEAALAQMALYFPTVEIADLELPAGAALLEQFMEAQWGDTAPRTYNKNLSFLREFFKFQVRRGRMRSNPTEPIERAKARGVHRTTFTPEQCEAILAAATTLRDRVALRLLLHYGLRQGALRAVQYKHFDFGRRRLTIFTKGGAVRSIPIPEPHFWYDLEQLITPIGPAEPHHYLMPTAIGNRHYRQEDPTKPMSNRAAHYWWYARLEDAGIVAPGQTSGERMHKARHTSGQRLLDATGNLKAVQKLLGHASVATTGDIYTDWDDEALARSLELALQQDEEA